MPACDGAAARHRLFLDHGQAQISPDRRRNVKILVSTRLVPLLMAALIPATVALAQTQSGPAAQPKRQMRASPDALARLQDGRIAMVKEALKLNDEQLKLWAPVEAQIRASFAARQQARSERGQTGQQSAARPSLPDRLDRASARMAKRAADLKAFADAFRPFYNSLNDEQKAVAGVVLRASRGHRHPARWARR
jgi:hypothetical protein